MRLVFCFWGVFTAGFCAAINLTRLLPTNPNYEAAWWKVGACVISAIAFGIYAAIALRYMTLLCYETATHFPNEAEHKVDLERMVEKAAPGCGQGLYKQTKG